MPRVLIASDKFKGSLSGTEVASAVTTGLRRAYPDLSVHAVPVADGGDGTLIAAVAAGFRYVPVIASGPTGAQVLTGYASRGDLAVVELADVSGLVRLPGGVAAPMTSSTRGVGEVMDAAISAGARRVLLGLGGSASTDGGAGLVRALGARLLNATGHNISDGGAALAALATIQVGRLHAKMSGVHVVVACDVENPLTGPRGAASIYALQKGATPDQVSELDDALKHWADVVATATGRDPRERPGAGAAGGVGFAALALLNAELRPGIELMLDLVGFHDRLVGVDLVVTGEGALDEQTLCGKAPSGVAAASATAGIPVVVVCGQNALNADQVREAGISAVYALTDIEPDVQRCIDGAGPLLEQLGERIAADYLASSTSSISIPIPRQSDPDDPIG